MCHVKTDTREFKFLSAVAVMLGIGEKYAKMPVNSELLTEERMVVTIATDA